MTAAAPLGTSEGIYVARGHGAGDRCRVMGILNLTPDSFSDGGLHVDMDHAVEHGLRMSRQGADIIDVGGESTRPGAERVGWQEERRRVLPVVRELAQRGLTVSVDTCKWQVAEAALTAGAVMVNDVSGTVSPDMAGVVGAHGAQWVLTHHRTSMQQHHLRAEYHDVVGEVVAEIGQLLDGAIDLGVSTEQVLIDPGLGFSKLGRHNWVLLARMNELLAVGPPVLIGASRKSFIGELLATGDGRPRPVDQREHATTALTALAAAAGAWGVRVHDVAAAMDATRVVQAVAHAAAR